MNTLARLPDRFASEIKGVIECFDRIVLFGTYRPIGYPGAMEHHLWDRGIQFIDYTKSYANDLRLRIAARVKEQAQAHRITIQQVNAGERKEAVVEAMLQKRGRREGVICVLGAMERCRTFKVIKNQQTQRLALSWSPGKCQHYYVYFIHAELGLCYLRIPTWAPFRLQFYCNGHDWLERRMKAEGLTFKKADNCFTHLSDFARAQELAHEFDPQTLHRHLDRLAKEWVAVHPEFGHDLHWSIYQAEWATDIVFKNDRVLPDLYTQITRTAACEIGCSDIYRFLAKRHTSRSTAEVSSRLQHLPQGTRIKHTLGATSLKMYDKAGRVLRIECTTSDVTSFTHYRQVEPRQSAGASAKKPREKAGSVVRSKGSSAPRSQNAPMRKTLYSLPALAEAMRAVNQRYLAHISQWPDRTKERHDLREVTASVRDERERSHRGVNFFREEDQQFMQAVQRGEHHIQGLRSRSLRQHLPGWKPGRIGRALRRFHAHGLLKKVAGTHKYYLTKRGSATLVAGQQLVERIVLPALAA